MIIIKINSRRNTTSTVSEVPTAIIASLDDDGGGGAGDKDIKILP